MAMVILVDLLTFDGAELACALDPRNYGSGAGKPSSFAQSFIVTQERPTEERLGMSSDNRNRCSTTPPGSGTLPQSAEYR